MVKERKKRERGKREKKREELIIEKLRDFNKGTLELIEPNRLLSATMCNGNNMRSIEE